MAPMGPACGGAGRGRLPASGDAGGRLVLRDVDGLVERVARTDASPGRCRCDATDVRLDLVGADAPAGKTAGRVVDQDRLGLVVEGDLLVLIRLGGGLGDQRVEVRVAVLDVVVAAAADEQTELVVRVRVVGTPGVAGDRELAGRRARRKTGRSRCRSARSRDRGLVRQASARNATRGSWPAPELKPNFSWPRSAASGDAERR